MYYPPTRSYYPPTILYYPPTRMYYPPSHMYYLPKITLSTNLRVLSTTSIYYPPTPMYSPPTLVLLSTNPGHSDWAMPALPVAVDAQIDP